jgi:hypothetical protein
VRYPRAAGWTSAAVLIFLSGIPPAPAGRCIEASVDPAQVCESACYWLPVLAFESAARSEKPIFFSEAFEMVSK